MINFLFTKTPLLFFIQSLWRDEAFSYLAAKKDLLSIIVNSARDFSPPFYYFVLHYWIILFGKSEIVLRSLSFIFFWATIYVVYLILTDIMKFDFKKSIIYLLLFVINPLLLYYAFEARMYTMLAFFSTLSFYALYKKKSKLYIISAVLGLYTHYFMVFVVLGQYLYSKFKQGIVLLAFSPWLLYILLTKNIVSQSFWITKFEPSHLFTFISSIYTGYEADFKFFDKSVFMLSACLWVLMLYFFFKTKKAGTEKKHVWELFFIWGIGIPFFVAVISIFKPIFLPRYLIFSSVGLLFLMVSAFEKMPIIAKTIIIAFFVAITCSYQKFQILDRQKSNMKKPISEIKLMMNPGDVLFVTSELDFFTAQYYFGENHVYIYGKTYEEIPNYVGKVLIKKTDIAQKLPYFPYRAFVLDSWGNYTIQQSLY